MLQRANNSPPTQSQQDTAWFTHHWKWLQQPLCEVFLIADLQWGEFEENAHHFMKLAIAFKLQPDQLAVCQSFLLRRVLASAYRNAWRQAEPGFEIAQIHQPAIEAGRSWAGMLQTAYGGDAINLDGLSKEVYKQMINAQLIVIVPPQPPVQPASPTPVREVRQPVAPVEQTPVRRSPEPDFETLMDQTKLTTSRPEAITNQEFSVSGNSPEYMHEIGLRLAAKLTKRLAKNDKERIEYLAEASTGSQIYYGQLVFQLPESIDFDAITDRIMQIELSKCGFAPNSTSYHKELLKNYQLAIDLPVFQDLDPEYRRSNLLLKHLIAEANAFPLFTKERIAECIDTVGQYLRSQIYPGNKHLRYLAGFSSRGEVISARLINRAGAGLAIAGKTGCGKSSQTLGALGQCMIALSPEEFQFAAMDFKGRAQTLSLVRGLPHLWMPPTLAEWKTLVAAHGLDQPHEDYGWIGINLEDEDLWSESDLAIPAVSWKGKDALALLDALKREKNRRSAIFDRYSLQNIFEYDEFRQKDSRLPDLPLLPIFLEEGGGFAGEVGAARACAEVQEITSQWRAYGMPLIETVQDGKAATALPPDARMNFGSKILFKCSAECAERLIGKDKEWVQSATRLLEQVDAIVETDSGVAHIHPFLMDTKTISWLIPILKHKYRDWTAKRSASRLNTLPKTDEFALPAADLWEPQAEADVASDSKDQDRDRFDKLIKMMELNEAIDSGRLSGREKVSTNQALIELVGKYKYANTTAYPSGPKTAINGSNRDRAIKSLKELALQFGMRLSDQEIRGMSRLKAS